MQCFLSCHILKNFAKVLYSAHQNNTQEVKHTVLCKFRETRTKCILLEQITTVLEVLHCYSLVLRSLSEQDQVIHVHRI